MGSTSDLGAWTCKVCGRSVPWSNKKGEFVSSYAHKCNSVFNKQIKERFQMRLKVFTDWYGPDPDSKPCRQGIYLTKNYIRSSAGMLTFWNGTEWSFPNAPEITVSQHKYWCGLAFDPNDCVMTYLKTIVLRNAQMEPA